MADKLNVGDSVLLLKPGQLSSLTPRWTSRWSIQRARHPTYWIVHTPNGVERVVHRRRIQVVPQDRDWSYETADNTDVAPGLEQVPPTETNSQQTQLKTHASDSRNDTSSAHNLRPGYQTPPLTDLQHEAEAPPTTTATLPKAEGGKPVRQSYANQDGGHTASPVTPPTPAATSIPVTEPPIRLTISRIPDTGRITRSTLWKIKKPKD